MPKKLVEPRKVARWAGHSIAWDFAKEVAVGTWHALGPIVTILLRVLEDFRSEYPEAWIALSPVGFLLTFNTVIWGVRRCRPQESGVSLPKTATVHGTPQISSPDEYTSDGLSWEPVEKEPTRPSWTGVIKRFRVFGVGELPQPLDLRIACTSPVDIDPDVLNGGPFVPSQTRFEISTENDGLVSLLRMNYPKLRDPAILDLALMAPEDFAVESIRRKRLWSERAPLSATVPTPTLRTELESDASGAFLRVHNHSTFVVTVWSEMSLQRGSDRVGRSYSCWEKGSEQHKAAIQPGSSKRLVLCRHDGAQWECCYRQHADPRKRVPRTFGRAADGDGPRAELEICSDPPLVKPIQKRIEFRWDSAAGVVRVLDLDEEYRH